MNSLGFTSIALVVLGGLAALPAGAARLQVLDPARSSDAGAPSGALVSAVVRAGEWQEPAKEASRARGRHVGLPLGFEPLPSGAPTDVDYQARGAGYQVYVGSQGAALALRRGVDGGGADGALPLARGEGFRRRPATAYEWVRVRFEGAAPDAEVRSERPLPGRIHRLTGDDRHAWQTGLRSFERVRYRGVYPGIDVAFYGRDRELEYDFIVAPGASHEAVSLRFDGVEKVDLSGDGSLRLQTRHGVLVQRAPVAYQEGAEGREEVVARYAMRGDGTVGFHLGVYDPERPLVIDPVLSYATLLGGLGFDQCWDLAIDGDGATYLVGETESPSFPARVLLSAQGFQTNYQGGVPSLAGDAFVAKLNPDGTALEWMTYLGGSDLDVAFSVARDGDGSVVVGGFTTSTNFPLSAGAFQTRLAGITNKYSNRYPLDGFVTRLAPDGSAVMASTLWGGDEEDQVLDVALLGDGRVVAGGSTLSTNLPVPAASGSQIGGDKDGFVVVFSADLASVVAGRFVGGQSTDTVEGVAVAAGNRVYATGWTLSTNLPATTLQVTNAGLGDGWVAGLRADDLSLGFLSYLGGSGTDYLYRAAGDPSGAVWVVGQSASANFPVRAALQSTNAGITDGVLARVSADGVLEFGTYFGGPDDDALWDVQVDAAGRVHFAGLTDSLQFTGITTNVLQYTNAGNSDIMIGRLSPDGTLYSTFYGGPGGDTGYAVGADGAGNTYVAGRARSVAFPVSSTNVAQAVYGGGTSDGFALKVAHEPALAAALTAEGVAVSWPAPNPGFVLETAGGASAGAVWTEAPVAPVVEAGRHVVRLSPEATNSLFRLRWVR